MRNVLRALLGSFPVLALLAPQPATAASLQSNVNYGANGAVMNVFVPDAVDPFPAIVVTLLYCNGQASDAAAWFTPTLAEQYGFIVIAPGLPAGDGDGCWDVGSTQSLSHNGGSHSKAIAQMVAYAVTTYGADPKRVYVAGASSGAMMVNVMLGAYPDVFAAGAVLAGVPFGCWTAGDGWSSACADGSTTKSAVAWGDLVRNAYPGFTGTRPRVQLWHGTADTTLHYKNLAEEVKQWTNVFGISETATSTQMNTPKSGWTRSSYESNGEVVLEVNIGQGLGHELTGSNPFPSIIEFFGLEEDVAASGGTGAGGMSSGGMSNGGMPSGGMSNGGMPNGGMPNGGMSGGGAAEGGLSGGGESSGGMAPAAGGMSTTPSGGMTSMGGTGGRSMTGMGGRALGSGGSSQGGMTPASGGTASSGGGRSAAGGSSGSGDVEPVDPAPLPDAGGCGCRVVTSAPSQRGLGSLLATLGVAAFWLLRRARAAA